MSVRVNIKGEIKLPEDAVVSVFDRQFLYGDGIYDTFRTFGGQVFLARAHIRRFRRSAEGIGLPFPFTDDWIFSEMQRTLDAAANPESVVRMILSRGQGEYGLDPTGIVDPSLVIIVRPLIPPGPELRRYGIDVMVPTVRRTSPRALASHIKSGNYLNQAMALAEGRQKGAYEVVMLDEEGNVTEGSTSNVFWGTQGTLFTPSVEAGVLPGVTRALILGLAHQLEIRVVLGQFPAKAFMSADEAFITATVKELIPIRTCDGQAFGAEVPGPLTEQLMTAYHSLTAQRAVGAVGEDALEALIALGGGEIE